MRSKTILLEGNVGDIELTRRALQKSRISSEVARQPGSYWLAINQLAPPKTR